MRRRSASSLGGLLVLCWVVGMAGCATGTGGDLSSDGFAARHGMERGEVGGVRFQHRLYARGEWKTAARVHVYLEGDGTPWTARHRIAADPTPRNPLALRLMAVDPTSAIYVGRPCYFGLAKADGCSPWLWTHGRYGAEVVESMARAIEQALPPEGGRRITLIGYSGGGALAVLIAPHLSGVDELLTVAANLDIDDWSDRHGYDRLTGSLNPADQRPLDARIHQLHLVGGKDDQVPRESISRYLVKNPSARVEVFPEFDHRCCWVERWPELLSQLGP